MESETSRWWQRRREEEGGGERGGDGRILDTIYRIVQEYFEWVSFSFHGFFSRGFICRQPPLLTGSRNRFREIFGRKFQLYSIQDYARIYIDLKSLWVSEEEEEEEEEEGEGWGRSVTSRLNVTQQTRFEIEETGNSGATWWINWTDSMALKALNETIHRLED